MFVFGKTYLCSCWVASMHHRLLEESTTNLDAGSNECTLAQNQMLLQGVQSKNITNLILGSTDAITIYYTNLNIPQPENESNS